jgi:hypothetical protein
MSWQDKLKNGVFTITTGDNKSFAPTWKDSTKSTDFNATSFEFIDVDGTFVDRRKPKSSQYDLVIYFQGEDCNDLADEFEDSAKDPRYWVIEHPLYGTLKGQPLSLGRNDSTINIVEISIDFWESIITQYVEKRTTIKDDISDRKKDLDLECANNFDLKADVKPSNQNDTKESINTINSEFNKYLTDSDYNDYQQVLSETKDASGGIMVDKKSIIIKISELIDLVKNFNAPTNEKIDSLIKVYEIIFDEYGSESITDFNRYYFESVGSAVISSMCLVALNPNENDYISRSDILNVSKLIDKTYLSYFQKINDFGLLRNNQNNNYSSSFKIQSKLNFITKKTLYGLFGISFDFKQERVVELLHDSNLILLTHKYLGLNDDDSNIEKFRQINQIKNNRLFIVRKGFKIKYFI